MDPTTIKLITLIVGVATLIVGVATFVKAVFEFNGQNTLKRFEKFQEMRTRNDEDPDLKAVRDAMYGRSGSLKDLSTISKYAFMGFFEEIAMMLNSGLIREVVAFYMFSFDARQASKNEDFWCGIKRDDPYWSLFCSFCKQMIDLESRYKRNGKLDLPVREIVV
jgi:hypothetical protein